MSKADVVPSAPDPEPAPLPGGQWPRAIYDILKAFDVHHMSYVPDAGHSTLIKLLSADPEVTSNVLTTEEEGVAIAAGAWLGGQRSVLLMQSSGVGNCINMLSLPVIARFPLLMLVTMRGEWSEFNPWQVPMGRATQPALVGFLERNRVTIENKLDTLCRVFTVGAALLGVEVLCWLIDLTWGKT